MQSIGAYQILGELGRGAMGIVFRGFDPAIGRPVAIKMIQAGQFATAEEQSELKMRLGREATAAGKLSHPNIVTIYQLGEEGGVPYVVLELVDGSSLEAILASGQPQDPKTAASILRQVADALDYAHGEGIIHRDVKPANILIRPDGKVKITDFGIARITSQTVTQTGFIVGTLAYMSPEQIMSAKVTGKADQFSLGVIAYQMLSGKRPFTAEGAALMFQIMTEKPPLLHEAVHAAPARASEVIRKAMEKKPEDRFPTCKEFVQRLSESLTGMAPRGGRSEDETQTLAPAAGLADARRGIGARRSRLVLAVGLGVAALSLAGVTWWRLKSQPGSAVETSKASPIESVKQAPRDDVAKNVQSDPGKRQAAREDGKSAQPAPTKNIRDVDSANASGAKTSSKEQVKQAALPEASAAVLPSRKEQPPGVGDAKVNPKDGLTYVWIPPGSFAMGCSPGDRICKADETTHQVTISKGFWIGKTEATQEAYQRVMGTNPSYFKGPKLPVETITWKEAQSFCMAAGLRLPTEAEWEYAARAGSRGTRFGDAELIAWFGDNSGKTTHDAGGKRANAWGLHDMLGNVSEWVADWFADYPPGAALDPTGPAAPTMGRTIRGGAWNGLVRSMRVSHRLRMAPRERASHVGVRCVGAL